MSRVAVDLDDVVAAFTPAVLERWNSRIAVEEGSLRRVSLEDITHWEALNQSLGFDTDEWWSWLRQNEDLYSVMGTNGDAFDALDELKRDGHQIVYVTARPTWSAGRTVEWLESFDGLYDGLVFTNDKAAIEADVYIDDAPHHLAAIAERRPDALLLRWVQPWNTDAPGVPVTGWAEVMRFVRAHEMAQKIPPPTESCPGDGLRKMVSALKPFTISDGEEVRVTSETGGQKGSKLEQLGAVDPLALQVLGKVTGFGANKYEPWNFARGYPWSLSFNALERHLLSFWAGEENDPESGLPHLGHAMWHCATLLTFALRGRGTDDRLHRVVPDQEAAA